jgi:hypothetical protein
MKDAAISEEKSGTVATQEDSSYQPWMVRASGFRIDGEGQSKAAAPSVLPAHIPIVRQHPSSEWIPSACPLRILGAVHSASVLGSLLPRHMDLTTQHPSEAAIVSL